MISEETQKYLRRIIEKQEEILNLGPWHVRDALKEFQAKLKEVLKENEG